MRAGSPGSPSTSRAGPSSCDRRAPVASGAGAMGTTRQRRRRRGPARRCGRPPDSGTIATAPDASFAIRLPGAWRAGFFGPDRPSIGDQMYPDDPVRSAQVAPLLPPATGETQMFALGPAPDASGATVPAAVLGSGPAVPGRSRRAREGSQMATFDTPDTQLFALGPTLGPDGSTVVDGVLQIDGHDSAGLDDLSAYAAVRLVENRTSLIDVTSEGTFDSASGPARRPDGRQPDARGREDG